MASLRAGRSFTRLSPATENLGNVRDADAQGPGNFPNELSGIGVSQHTIAKVLRIGPAAPPRHLHLRSIQPETFRIPSVTRFASPARFRLARKRSHCKTLPCGALQLEVK